MQIENPDRKKDLMVIGRLGSPFGILGFLRVHSYSGETGHFGNLSEVLLDRDGERTRLRVEEIRVNAHDVFMRLSGCSSPEDARAWVGWEILVPRSLASPLGPGEYYIADLEGCALTFKGSRVGTILAVQEGGGASLLEVKKDSGKTVLLPFRNEFIGRVDIQARELELLVDWILE